MKDDAYEESRQYYECDDYSYDDEDDFLADINGWVCSLNNIFANWKICTTKEMDL